MAAPSRSLKVSVLPEEPLPSPPAQQLFARVRYTREVDLDDPQEGEPPTTRLPGSVREELDDAGGASIDVDDAVLDAPVSAQLELAEGIIVWTSAPVVPTQANDGAVAKFTVPNSAYAAASKISEPAAVPVLTRAGRFVRLSDCAMHDFVGYRLYVAPIRPATLPSGKPNPQMKAVRQILGLEGEGELTTFEVRTMHPAELDATAVNAVGASTATVHADGTFDISIDILGVEVAWLWILLGKPAYAGYQLDAVPTQPASNIVLMLPPEGALPEHSTVTTSSKSSQSTTSGRSGGAVEITGATSPHKVPCGCQVCQTGDYDDQPMDFDERQLLDNPAKFSDDPGRFCSPFEKTQRILGERRFFTILRIDQPDIGSRGSLMVSRPVALDLSTPIRRSFIARKFRPPPPGGSTPPPSVRPLASPAPSAASLPATASAAAAALAAAAATATDDVPLGLGAISSRNFMRLDIAERVQDRYTLRDYMNRTIFKPSRTFWSRWLLTHTNPRKPVSDANPIEWEGDPTVYQAASVAGGHVLEWRTRWRSNGYSLGDVAHTLTLAPRQTKRISKVSWERREEAARREETDLTDALTQVTARQRDYSDAVQSSLSEWSRGGSKARTTGVAGGIGFALGPVVIGGGAAHGRASSSAWQKGGRRVAAAEQQQLRDAIRQYGESVRRRESTVVTEISQEEDVEAVTETLRNVNYCHALTVVYYDILRHLRIDTEFSGVRECLYVPFSITPFDVDKALKWRDKLRRGLLDRSLRWTLDRLDEVASAFADSDIPDLPRRQYPINYVSGSLYVQLSIDRPRDQEEEETMQAYLTIWLPFQQILGNPVKRVIERIKAERDSYFQREVAPTMAAHWCDRLAIEVEGIQLPGVDFTLASRYRFDRQVRVDFTVPVQGALTREQLQNVVVRATHGLPQGSVANLRRLTLHYYTDHFNRRLYSDSGSRDLVLPESGVPDPGAALFFPLSSWDLQNLRDVIDEGVERLVMHLNANLVYYHKVLWWLMDRDEMYMMLDGFTAPHGRRYEDGKWVEDTGRSIASVVERDPLAILGNTLVFRVAAGAFLGIGGHESPDDLHRYYYDSRVRAEPFRVSLPTEGLYAQALMDKCVSCEEHGGSTDWVLTDKDPELDRLADLLGTRRAAPPDLEPSELPPTLINLQNAPAAPAPTGLGGVLEAVTKGDAFRDITGLAGTQAAAQAALSQAASLATGFGSLAVDLQKAKNGTTDAKRKLDNIKKARTEGLISDADARKQAEAVLQEQNMSPARRGLMEEPVIKDAISRDPGASVEVTRQDGKATESVKVSSAKEPTKAKRKLSILGSPAPGTNRGSTVAEALRVIEAFAARDGDLKFKVSRVQVTESLKDLVQDPDSLDQGSLNLCGPAATVRTLLRRDPEMIAKVTIDLVEKGRGRLGTDPIEPGSDLRNQSFDPSWGPGAAGWVLMSSMRDDENWLFDFEGTPEEDISAATTPGEVRDWLEATNLYTSVRNQANLTIREDVSHLLGLSVDGNTDNVLLIHSHMMLNSTVKGSGGTGGTGPAQKKSDQFILNSFPNHFVVLANQPSSAEGRVQLDVWSWGAIYEVLVSEEVFNANYYGAVVARADV